MALLSKDKRDRLILLIIGTIAIVVGLWYGVIRTRRERLEDSKTRRDAVIDKLEKARVRVKQAEKVEAEMEAATRKLRAIEETMAPGVNVYTWAQQLLEKAKVGHEVNIIDVTRPSKAEVGLLPQFPYEAAIFSVRGAAYYHDFGKFLADFENRFPYFRVQNLLLGTSGESSLGAEASARGVEEKLQFKLDIVTVVRPTL
jgi:hypothetical protein